MKIFLLICFVLLLISGYLFFSYTQINSQISKRDSQPPPGDSRAVLLGQGQTPFYILVLGDDLPAGVGATDIKKSFPYKMAEQLSDTASTVNLINLSKPGATSEDVINSQIPQALNEHQVSHILIEVGTNDIIEGVDGVQFQKNYESILGKLRINSAKIFALNIPYLGSPEFLTFPFSTLQDLKIRQFNNIIKEAAKLNGANYLDIHNNTPELKSDESVYSKDQFHPNDQEYSVFADLILDQMKNVVYR